MKRSRNRESRLHEIRNNLLKRILSMTKGQLLTVSSGRISDFIESLDEKERHYKELAMLIEDIRKLDSEAGLAGNGELNELEQRASDMIKEIHMLEQDVRHELEDRLKMLQGNISDLRHGRETLKAYSPRSRVAASSVMKKG